MKFVFAFLFCLVAIVTTATDIKLYEWEKDRTRYKLTAAEQQLSEIVLKHHVQYDYTFEKDEFVMYSTIHRIAFVNNDEAIQKHNRIVISMGKALELVELKARAINKDGKVVYFDKSNLKEVKNEDTGNSLRIFAIEGIEIGSEVEYYFIRKMQPDMFERSFMQFNAPVKQSSFSLSAPGHLVFDFKSYNGYPDITKQESEDRNMYQASFNDIPALAEEPFSYLDPNRKRVEFKLAYNTAKSKARLYTWDEAAKTFYRILTEKSKDDEKALDKFLKTLQDDPSKPLDERVRGIEDKIKNAVKTSEDGAGSSQIESILKSKLASQSGMTKLFVCVFERLKIACNPVITCNRKNIKFDPDFDTWGYLDDYILYFPDTKKFLSPYEFALRYPLVEAMFTAQRGLFVEPFAVGDVRSALASIHEIPAAECSSNVDNLDIDVSFNDDMATAHIKQKRLFSGYTASTFARYYNLMTKEQRVGMVDELIKQTAPDATVKNWTANTSLQNLIDQFVIDADFESSHFNEKAGPRVLFKVGELIGPQVEMYRAETRATPVENDHNRTYERKILIHLPANYQVKNLQDIKLDVAVKDGSDVPYSFRSDYIVKDNVLEVTIQEYYRKIYAPVSQYEDFRKVVNAAADFNKITLILEKK